MGLREIQVLLERDFGRSPIVGSARKRWVCSTLICLPEAFCRIARFGGHSMEGGPTCCQVSEEEYAGMVLIPPFDSTYHTVRRVSIFLGDRLMNFDRIVGMKEPLSIVHGMVDEAIPYGYSEELV